MPGKGKEMHLYSMPSEQDSSDDDEQGKRLKFDPGEMIPILPKHIKLPVAHSRDSCLLCFSQFKRSVKWIFDHHFLSSPHSDNTLIYLYKAVLKQENECKSHDQLCTEAAQRKPQQPAQDHGEEADISASSDENDKEEIDLK